MTFKEVRTFLCVKILKWKRDNDDDNQDVNELLIKILRVILTLMTFFTDKEDSMIRPDILTSALYAEAVRDSIWEEMWKNVIYTELTVLMINEI